MKKVKSALQRITMGVLALVFTVTLAVPKAKAVTGVDDVSVGIMAVLVHLDSIGGSLAVQQGTALATQNAVTALATQAGAAGALGAGVTGTAALATIGGACVAAAAGGFTIGYIGYQTLTKLAEWIRQSKLTGTAENKIYVTGGDFKKLVDGSDVFSSIADKKTGVVYTTQGGSSFWVNGDGRTDTFLGDFDFTFISANNGVMHFEVNNQRLRYWPNDSIVDYSLYDSFLENGTGHIAFTSNCLYDTPYVPNDASQDVQGIWIDYFVPQPEITYDKQEVTYIPPAIWTPPAPAPGQDVYYNPYPNVPQKPIKEIVEDVPKDIYDKKFSPAPPQIVEPAVPPVNPDLPPVVNPNPPVDPPAEVQPYTVQLGDVFPFCIPFDLYHMVTLFVAEPEAPHAKWEFSLPFAAGTYKVEWDLQEWDEVAALCRKLELILFCVGLAVVTSKLIKW